MTKLETLIADIPKNKLRAVFDRQTLYKHIKGQRRPDVESARKYCVLLGITLDEFYDRISQ